jgi:hypothetical protein
LLFRNIHLKTSTCRCYTVITCVLRNWSLISSDLFLLNGDLHSQNYEYAFVSSMNISFTKKWILILETSFYVSIFHRAWNFAINFNKSGCRNKKKSIDQCTIIFMHPPSNLLIMSLLIIKGSFFREKSIIRDR